MQKLLTNSNFNNLISFIISLIIFIGIIIFIASESTEKNQNYDLSEINLLIEETNNKLQNGHYYNEDDIYIDLDKYYFKRIKSYDSGRIKRYLISYKNLNDEKHIGLFTVNNKIDNFTQSRN